MRDISTITRDAMMAKSTGGEAVVLHGQIMNLRVPPSLSSGHGVARHPRLTMTFQQNSGRVAKSAHWQFFGPVRFCARRETGKK